MEDNKNLPKQIVWWKDLKFLTGVTLVILSFVLGFYGKVIFVIKFYEPFYVITGLSIWTFSWILLFLGAFLVGWETVKMIQNRINYHVKKTVKGTYDYTKGIPRKSIKYTKELHKKSIEKIAKTSKNIAKRMKKRR